MNRRRSYHSARPLVAALLAFLLAAVVAASLIWRLEQADIGSLRQRTSLDAASRANALQINIERALSATYSLAAVVRQGNGVVRDFEAVAGKMLPLYPGASSLQLAPGGVVLNIVPLAGNEQAIGHDLLKDRTRTEAAFLARDSGKLTLDGPFSLIQGGLGAVGRLPVFLDDTRGSPTFWGFASVLIRFPEALEAADMPGLSEQGLAWELWRIHPDSGEKLTIAASAPASLIDPVVRSVEVPNAIWHLSVAPAKGWRNARTLSIRTASGLLFSLVLAYLAKLLIELRVHKRGLEDRVAERTAEVRAREADLNRAQSIARVGSWWLDLVTRQMHGSAEALRILGVSGGAISYKAFLNIVHADDREAVDAATRASLKGAPYDLEYRVTIDGATRWVHSSAELSFDADGKLSKALGTIQDITERKLATEALHKSEARFRSLTQMSSDWYWEQDENFRFTSMDGELAARTGISTTEHIGKTRWELPTLNMTDADWAKHKTQLDAHLPFRNLELRRPDVDGRMHWVSIDGDPVFDGRGGFLGYRGVGRDITERKRAEHALKSSEDKFRKAFDVNPDSININRLEDGMYVSINRGFTQMTGYSEDDVIGRTSTELNIWVNPEDRARLVEGLRKDGMVSNLEARFRAKNGDIIYGLMSAALIEIENVSHLVNVTHDITKRKQREQDLLRFRLAMDATAEAIYLVDRSSMRFIDVNAAACAMLGETREQILALGPEGVLSSSRADLERAYDAVIAGGAATARGEMPRQRKDGSQVWVEFRRRALRTDAGWTIVTVARDITEHKRAAEALRAAEEQFRGLVEQSITGIYIIQDDKFAYVNPRFAEILGYHSAEELSGRDAFLSVAEEDRSAVREKTRLWPVSEVSSVSVEFTALRKDGAMIEVGLHCARAQHKGRPAVIGLMQDISDKKRAEEQIQSYLSQLETAFMSSVKVATTLSELRDPYTAGHERRVAEIAVAIGAELGFDARRQEGLRVAGYLHDIGKITVPVEILCKPGKLSALELELIKGHSQSSYDVLKQVEFPWPVAEVALQHHERIDGSGYPQGLKGEAILLEARITAVADVIEAMSSHRPYRHGLGIEKALAEIERGRGSIYDSNVANACLHLFREKGYAIPE